LARVSAEPGHTLETEEDIAQVCGENSFKPEDLEYEMDEYAWADAWEYSESPQAKAYALLKELNLGCSLHADGMAPGPLRVLGGAAKRSHGVSFASPHRRTRPPSQDHHRRCLI